MFKKLFLILSLFTIANLFSQTQDGYWDNIRITNETITLKAGEKKSIKTANFPEGTTEVVYRITLLDDNQKLSSSLVSVLKAIPDPTGISQGTAGAVFLLSTISGDDKCKYAIFEQNTDAENFLKTGKTTNACVIQNTPINKEAKLLSKDSKCDILNSENLYFTFESDNWIMNQKIVLEVVPWVNKKASRGWNKKTKKELETICNLMLFKNKLLKKELFVGEFINLVTEKYTYTEFNDILPAEKTVIIQKIAMQSLQNTNQINDFMEYKRTIAWDFYKKNEHQKAIDYIIEEIIETKLVQAKDYSALGDIYIETKQFVNAKEAYLKATQLDANQLWYQLKYANALVFNKEISHAKDIHKKYKSNNIDAKTSWPQQAKFDIEFYKSKGLNVDDFKKILRIVE